MSDSGIPTEFTGRLASGKDWREIVAWVGDLPPMPQVAARAINKVEDPSTTANELTDILSKDTALAARVLKIANSAMFARQREITTLTQAVMIIGFKALKGIIVAATLRQLNKGTGKIEQLVWENSTASAIAAHLIAKKLKKRYLDEVFLLGLLHSLGQIVLLSHLPNDYKIIIKNIKEKQCDFVSAEQEVLGYAHPLIGALVAKKWNFSADTCQIILHYKDTTEDPHPESELEEKTALVHLADLITHLAGIGNPEGYAMQNEAALALATYLGMTGGQEDLNELMAQTKEQFDRDRGVFG